MVLNVAITIFVVSLTDACLTVVYCSATYSKFGADFGLYHAVHIAVQNGELQSRQLQRAYKLIVFAVIGLLMFKAVYWIHWQSFIVREVYGFNDCPAPVRSVT